MTVDPDQLISQMETLADKLDASEETQPIASMIRGWVLCVQEILDPDRENENYTNLVQSIKEAVSDANGYRPYSPT